MDRTDLTFIVDLNELEDVDILPVSMDYTLTYGPRVLVTSGTPVLVGDWVKAHSDDDETVYFAEVVERVSDRDFKIKIHWDTCTPVLESIKWSARDYSAPYPYTLKTDDKATLSSGTGGADSWPH